MILCLLGIIGFLALHLATHKDEYDDSRKKFRWHNYVNKSWDNWIFAFIGGFVVLYGYPWIMNMVYLYKGYEDAPVMIEGYEVISGFFGGALLQKLWQLLKKFQS